MPSCIIYMYRYAIVLLELKFHSSISLKTGKPILSTINTPMVKKLEWILEEKMRKVMIFAQKIDPLHIQLV